MASQLQHHLLFNPTLFPKPTHFPPPQLLSLKLSSKSPRQAAFTCYHEGHSNKLPSKTLLKPLCSTYIPTHKSNPFIHNFDSLSTIKPYIVSQHKPIILGWLCSLISVTSLSLLVPKIANFTSSIAQINSSKLRGEGFAIAAFFFCRCVATYFQQALLWEAALNAVCEIRNSVFSRVLERELGFFEGGNGVSSGDVAYRLTAEAADVADTIYALLNTVVPSVLQLSAMAVRMLAISPGLSLISAMVIPCVGLAISFLGERLQKISRKARMSIAALSSYLNELLPAILFVKANNAEFSESARFQRLAHTDLSALLKKKKMKAFIPQIVQIVYFGALFTLCAGSLVVSDGCFNGCLMISFVTSLVFLVEPIQDVGKAYNEWKQGEPAIERLFNLSAFQCKVTEKQGAVTLDNIRGDVKFCDVSFKYEDNSTPILNKLDLHIKAGETVAFVGPSGGGKTTFIKLLLRFYDPISGYILVDNQNVRDMRLESLRRHISLVSQDTMLFSGTVAENIGYKDLTSTIDMEKVELAARTANADEFIRMLQEGYETNIGPRGSSLSGGQKQRIAIARALYQDSSILILDEATSALDSKSELLVRQALERLMKNRTVLIIAHRLETVSMANRVFLLDEGKLQELTRSSLVSSQHRLFEFNGLAI